MGVGSAVRAVGCFVEACEATGTTVDAIEFDETTESEQTATIDVTVSSSPPHEDTIAPASVTLDDGRLELTVESEPIGPTADHDVDVTVSAATIEPDGSMRATLGVSVPDEADAKADETIDDTATPDDATATGDTTASTGDRERDRPPFEDPELLASVYDACETFAEMSEAIEMDVTAETVRRYMIDYGIHEPASYGTADEAATDSRSASESTSEPADPSPVVLTDGVGLPDDVTVETLVETVSRSNTIYEVTRDLGLDRDDTVDLLAQLDLVDVVVGRASTRHERSIGREAIVDRLREL